MPPAFPTKQQSWMVLPSLDMTMTTLEAAAMRFTFGKVQGPWKSVIATFLLATGEVVHRVVMARMEPTELAVRRESVLRPPVGVVVVSRRQVVQVE
jgi:hypothetical protein